MKTLNINTELEKTITRKAFYLLMNVEPML